MKTSDVFGIVPKIRPSSYVDRGNLDDEIARQLERDIHVALRGESKCGKSWLRQKNIPNALVVQCRLSKTVLDIYVDILSQLDIKLEVKSESAGTIKGSVTAKGELGTSILGKIGIETSGAAEGTTKKESKNIGQDVNDLRFIADIIKASGRRVVIEDFHYMSFNERKQFAFDLKALWDYSLFIVIVGVWSQTNMLLHLNPDLSGRIHECSIAWTKKELEEVLEQGGKTLKIEFSRPVIDKLTSLAFGNVGILQKLTLMSLDSAKIYENSLFQKSLDDINHVDSAAMFYAEQLNPLYEEFAKNVSGGIRTRANSTGIYAHAMAAIVSALDSKLISGLKAQEIYVIAHARQNRIQLGNLKTILERIEELQVDADGRGLVIAYNQSREEVTIVDKQLLLYRHFCTIKWPWEDLIAEAEEIQVDDNI
jgi:hypothetical protein